MYIIPEPIASNLFALKTDPTDDFIDRLNYIYTVGALIFFAALTGTKQHFGSPIQCMTPAHFPSTWVSYSHDYCFVSNTYLVNSSVMITNGVTSTVMKQNIVYYQWVPYVLLLQAFLCCIPKFLWTISLTSRGLDLRSIVEEAIKLPALANDNALNEHVKKVASFAIAYFKQQKRDGVTWICCFRGYCISLYYVFTKWLHFAISLSQVLIINTFVGDSTLLWGFHLLNHVLSDSNWKSTTLFPRITFCDMKITHIGQINSYSVQCVLMINMLNEKVYLVLSFWLALLTMINLISALYVTVMLLCPYMRYVRLVNILQLRGCHLDRCAKRCIVNFTENVLKPDGVLLLMFISNHGGRLLTNELVREIWSVMGDRNMAAKRRLIPKSKIVEQVRNRGHDEFL